MLHNPPSRGLRVLAVDCVFMQLIGKGKGNVFNLKTTMIMEEIFARTLMVVAQTTGISEEVITSKDMHEEVVDARMMLVYMLSEQGLYPSLISRKTGLGERAVRYAIMKFPDRIQGRKYLSHLYASARKPLCI